jgi:mannose-6-phosphate isomerase-like protein (cupin superfamily)
MTSFPLDRTYVQLQDGGPARTIEVGDDFWERIEERTELHDGRLICWFTVGARESDHSEMHPAGDELLVAVAGEVEVVLEPAGAPEQVIRMPAGHACLVPRGTWHRLRAPRRGALLSITPGKGTEHR